MSSFVSNEKILSNVDFNSPKMLAEFEDYLKPSKKPFFFWKKASSRTPLLQKRFLFDFENLTFILNGKELVSNPSSSFET